MNTVRASARLLRLAHGPVLNQQLLLIMGSMRTNLYSILLTIGLVRWFLTDASNANAMNIWCALAVLSQIVAKYFCHRQLKQVWSLTQAHRIVWILLIINIFAGLLWGALTWIGPSLQTLAQTMMILGVIAGMVGGSVSTLAPIPPLFVAFASPAIGALIVNAWQQNDPTFRGFGVVCVLFLLALMDQARKSAKATQASIRLRFDNADLLERVRIESQVAQEAHRDAELANAAKSKFLAAASHDLRQPIHAQGLFLEVLSRTQLDAQQRELLSSASAACSASAEMLGTLFDFSRIEAGVIETQAQAFRVQTLLNKIEREFAQQADAKDLVYRSRESDLILQSDPALVELILRNLVSNAIRYTKTGGLLVACRRRGAFALLEVWDTGIGIEQSQQREVFREFHQLGNPERDRRKGFGLGLAIVEGLARRLQHRLSLDSKPHHGSVFRLALPIATDALPLDLEPNQSAKAQSLNARVLVIDDDELVRDGMFQLLNSWGCNCQIAESIEQAIELTLCNTPDLVISDYRLREQRSGLDAIAAVRKASRNDLPSLLITGDTAPDRLRQAVASGITLLHKPVSASKLYSGVVTALA